MDEPDQSNLPAVLDFSSQSGPLEIIDSIAPSGWRMRFAKAAAQLIAGSEKGAEMYGEIRERIDIIEGRSIVSKTLAQAVAQQAKNDPDVMERATARFLGGMIQKHQNLEAVIVGATQLLPALPPPQDPSTPPVPQLDAKAEKEIDPDDIEPLNPDWATTFAGIAENATTDELRDRLSRILAGELRSPGTYARATVRAIAELERVDLEAVKLVLPYVLGKFIIRTRDFKPLPSIDELLPLVESGVITDANSNLSRTSSAAPDDGDILIFDGNDWGMAINRNGGQPFDIPIVPLTKVGISVIDLLGRVDERIILRKIAEEMPKDWYKSINIGKKVGDLLLGPPFEQVMPKPVIIENSFVSGSNPFGSVVL